MKALCGLILKIIGWKIVGQLPSEKKFILIVAPHTSNWDFLLGLCSRFVLGVKIHFLAKSQLFFFPLGQFLRAVGGIAVDRSKKGNLVEHVVSQFQQHDNFAITITPEGTRGQVKRWKEGFYHIACKANVPIAMVGFDYPTKEIRISAPVRVTGNIKEDFPQFVSFCRTIKGLYPQEVPDYQEPSKPL